MFFEESSNDCQTSARMFSEIDLENPKPSMIIKRILWLRFVFKEKGEFYIEIFVYLIVLCVLIIFKNGF